MPESRAAKSPLSPPWPKAGQPNTSIHFSPIVRAFPDLLSSVLGLPGRVEPRPIPVETVSAPRPSSASSSSLASPAPSSSSRRRPGLLPCLPRCLSLALGLRRGLSIHTPSRVFIEFVLPQLPLHHVLHFLHKGGLIYRELFRQVMCRRSEGWRKDNTWPIPRPSVVF